MLHTFTIPSVIEANAYELNRVAPDLLKGLKLFHDDGLSYIIGDLALSEGVAPHKTINGSPDETDYKLLAKAAMLVASKRGEGPLYVTTGFPYLTYQLYRQKAVEFFQANHNLRFDASPFSGTSISEQNVSVVKAMVIPELQGCDLAIRNGDFAAEGNFFIVSLGYGTFEAALSTPDGIIQRTAVSGPGLRYAVNGAIKELLRTHNIGLKTEQQFDQGFSAGRIVLNRTVINIEDIRKKYLQIYYREVISPLLQKTFSDRDFSMSKTLILCGGGALYNELVELFTQEFNGLLNVKVQSDPIFCASKGYAIHSKANTEGYNATAVGIDIGNASTIVSVIKDGVGSMSSSMNE